MEKNKILQWIVDNWKDISVFGAGVFAVVKAGIWCVRKYKKWIAPIRVWVKKVDDAIDQLSFNGGGSIKDMVFNTSETVKKIAVDMTVVRTKQAAIMELNDTALFECDKDGYCIKANVALCDIFDATLNQMVGHGWLQFIKNADKEAEAWNQAVESDNEISREYVVNPAKNKKIEIPCRYIAHIKRDDNQKVINVTGKVIKL